MIYYGIYDITTPMEKIALIGLGPHAKRIYYPYLTDLIDSNKKFSLELVIDLDINRKAVEEFLETQALQPKSILYLDAKDQISPKKIDPRAADALRENRITKAIISTEPKAHKIYLEECVRQEIPVVVDKPVTSPLGLTPSRVKSLVDIRQHASTQVYKDVMSLLSSMNNKPKSRILVQCQRRNHAGYKIVTDTMSEIVQEYGIPVTFIDIHHSDGMWNMPDEFIYRENHPYKYGYGKLMHSGYHFVDLLTSIEKINMSVADKIPDTVNIFSQAVRPVDQHTTVAADQYYKFFGKSVADKIVPDMQRREVRNYGEIDSFSQMQFTRKGKVITTAQLSLMQSGFSRRAWAELPKDTYKANGRVRHEFIDIHIGPLCSVQVHSYQSTEVANQPGQPYGPGDKNHFDIYIFRNSDLIGGKPFEHIKYGGMDAAEHKSNSYLGHNEEARRQTLDELMFDLPSNSELEQHISTNKMLSAIYKNHIKQHYNKAPYSKFKFKDIF